MRKASGKIGTTLMCRRSRTLLGICSLLAGCLLLDNHTALADSVIFFDDFSGNTLNFAWQVMPSLHRARGIDLGTFSVRH